MAETKVLKGHVIFLTGASGFLGTTIALKLLLSTSISKLFVPMRGGESALFDTGAKTVPPSILNTVREMERMVVLTGDMTKPSFGLDPNSIQMLAEEVTIVIHAASSINLGKDMAKILPHTLQLTLELAEMASDFKRLLKFVFVSTAYSNALLQLSVTDADTIVEERLYPIPRTNGDRLAERLGDFDLRHAKAYPWVYGYLKNVTEKLLVEQFTPDESGHSSDAETIAEKHRHLSEAKMPDRLLIVRPSVMGPAIDFPYPEFEVTGSAPTTTVFAGLIPGFHRRLICASNFPQPEGQARINEIPVDVVANQIIMHLHFDTKGVIHSAPQQDARLTLNTLIQECNLWRSLWSVEIKWKKLDWSDKQQTPILRLFGVLGSSYNFLTHKSELLAIQMPGELRRNFPVICGRAEVDAMVRIGRTSRGPHIRNLMKQFAKHQGIPSMFIPLTPLLMSKAGRRSARQQTPPERELPSGNEDKEMY